MKKIVFICTHNRCRSILAEAISNNFADARLEAKSAGAHPVDQVHPETLRHLKLMDIEVDNLSSQSWDKLDTYKPDLVITVCDQAANEPCPMWIGDTNQVHWSLPDPSKIKDASELKRAFLDVIKLLQNRLKFILQHRIEDMNADQFKMLFNKAKEKFS
jgi:arsenate reductase